MPASRMRSPIDTRTEAALRVVVRPALRSIADGQEPGCPRLGRELSRSGGGAAYVDAVPPADCKKSKNKKKENPRVWVMLQNTGGSMRRIMGIVFLWYVVTYSGKTVAGPFVSFTECQRIARAMHEGN